MKYISETIKFYDNNVDEYYKKTISLQETNRINKILSHIGENPTILDLGCGFGRDANIFQEKGCTAYGIDLSKNMINKAKKLYPKSKFYIMDMLKLDFDSNFFDGIWANALLLHLNKTDINLALLEINRVLKNKGIIYILLKEGNGEGFISDNRYNKAKKFFHIIHKVNLRI